MNPTDHTTNATRSHCSGASSKQLVGGSLTNDRVPRDRFQNDTVKESIDRDNDQSSLTSVTILGPTRDRIQHLSLTGCGVELEHPAMRRQDAIAAFLHSRVRTHGMHHPMKFHRAIIKLECKCSFHIHTENPMRTQRVPHQLITGIMRIENRICL